MENLIEELTKVNPSNLSEEGLKLFNKINEIIDRNRELEIKNRAIKNENNAYAQRMISLDNELQCEKEHSKYEWIRQNCLPEKLVNKLYIPKSLIKEKIEELDNMINEINKGNLQRYTVGEILTFKRFYEELLTPLKNV